MPEQSAATSPTTASVHPSYRRVLALFVGNSLVRAMTFRANFLLECVSAFGWYAISLAFYILIFQYTDSIGRGTGWGKFEFFVFLATTQLINSAVEGLFMPNTEEFSELVRTGGLDFALLKPIDTQFLVSLQKVDFSSLVNSVFSFALLFYALSHLEHWPSAAQIILYPLYLVCGVAVMYSLMIALAASSVWLGRNQTLYEFWFYITNFSRYPMEIYSGAIGNPIRWGFTFIIPIMVATNVPAQLLARPLEAQSWPLAAFTLVATLVTLAVSRWVFRRALGSYRSASS